MYYPLPKSTYIFVLSYFYPVVARFLSRQDAIQTDVVDIYASSSLFPRAAW